MEDEKVKTTSDGSHSEAKKSAESTQGKTKTQKVALVIAVVALVLLGGLGLIALDEMLHSGGTEPETEPVPEEVQGKCEIDECMKQLEPKMTVAQINEVMGFDGEKEAEKEAYTWKLSAKSKIVVEYKDGLGTITATYDKEKIKDDNFKLSKGYELQNLLREGTAYTYAETVEQFDGIAGHLATKAPTFKRYIWVNSDGITYGATFSDAAEGKSSTILIR